MDSYKTPVCCVYEQKRSKKVYIKNIPPGGYANKKGKGGVLGYVLAGVTGYFNRGRGV